MYYKLLKLPNEFYSRDQFSRIRRSSQIASEIIPHAALQPISWNLPGFGAHKDKLPARFQN